MCSYLSKPNIVTYMNSLCRVASIQNICWVFIKLFYTENFFCKADGQKMKWYYEEPFLLGESSIDWTELGWKQQENKG